MSVHFYSQVTTSSGSIVIVDAGGFKGNKLNKKNLSKHICELLKLSLVYTSSASHRDMNIYVRVASLNTLDKGYILDFTTRHGHSDTEVHIAKNVSVRATHVHALSTNLSPFIRQLISTLPLEGKEYTLILPYKAHRGGWRTLTIQSPNDLLLGHQKEFYAASKNKDYSTLAPLQRTESLLDSVFESATGFTDKLRQDRRFIVFYHHFPALRHFMLIAARTLTKLGYDVMLDNNPFPTNDTSSNSGVPAYFISQCIGTKLDTTLLKYEKDLAPVFLFCRVPTSQFDNREYNRLDLVTDSSTKARSLMLLMNMARIDQTAQYTKDEHRRLIRTGYMIRTAQQYSFSDLALISATIDFPADVDVFRSWEFWQYIRHDLKETLRQVDENRKLSGSNTENNATNVRPKKNAPARSVGKRQAATPTRTQRSKPLEKKKNEKKPSHKPSPPEARHTVEKSYKQILEEKNLKKLRKMIETNSLNQGGFLDIAKEYYIEHHKYLKILDPPVEVLRKILILFQYPEYIAIQLSVDKESMWLKKKLEGRWRQKEFKLSESDLKKTQDIEPSETEALEWLIDKMKNL